VIRLFAEKLVSACRLAAPDRGSGRSKRRKYCILTYGNEKLLARPAAYFEGDTGAPEGSWCAASGQSGARF